MQVRNCRIRESRFGHVLVLETSVQSGQYILGFQIKPAERLEAIFYLSNIFNFRAIKMDFY
jgi:hypothetical protein